MSCKQTVCNVTEYSISFRLYNQAKTLSSYLWTAKLYQSTKKYVFWKRPVFERVLKRVLHKNSVKTLYDLTLMTNSGPSSFQQQNFFGGGAVRNLSFLHCNRSNFLIEILLSSLLCCIQRGHRSYVEMQQQ